MNRLFTLLGTTVVAGLVGWTPSAQAQPGDARAGTGAVPRVARITSGLIQGVVVDERGRPLAGVMVSALGSVSALAVTDRQGTFVLNALPAGPYLVRAHRSGYTQSQRKFVQVGPGAPARFAVTLQRTPSVTGTPKVLAAGMGGGDDAVAPGVATAGQADAPDNSEQAWRFRHLKRSVLKDVTERTATIEGSDAPAETGTLSFLARAVGSSAQFLADLPLTGQANFLTSGSFDGTGPAVGTAGPLRGVAFISIGGPAFKHGDWAARAMTQGTPGSWFVGGSYHRRAPASHLFDIDVSYSTQSFSVAPGSPTGWGTDGSRSAGTIQALDRWELSPRLSFTYGGRYAHYDYLPAGLFSPRVSVTVVPVGQLRLTGSMSRRHLAPGAEEFLEPHASGLWVPPERTFIGVTPVEPEATDHFELALEQALWRDLVLAVRAFVQRTENQQSALFGPTMRPTTPRGRYEVASAGDVDTRGWSVGLSGSPTTGVRGSVAYGMVDAHWYPLPAGGDALLLVGINGRPSRERLHDLTTSLETMIAPTATSVFFTYKLNSGFARRDADNVGSGFDARFDLQILQRLPFLDFTSARWQALVAVRDLFRDAAFDASVYDELLVVRPPKRVVGGLLIRF